MIFWGASATREETATLCVATTLCWEQPKLHKERDSLHNPLYCPHLRSNVLTPSRNPDLPLLSLHKQISVNSLPVSLLYIPKASPLQPYFRQQEMVSKSQVLNLELLRCYEKYKHERPCQANCTVQTVSGHTALCSNITDHCFFTENVL